MSGIIESIKKIIMSNEKRLMIVGGIGLSLSAVVYLIDRYRKNSRYTLDVCSIDIYKYIRGIDRGWAMILYNDNDEQRLNRLCQILIFNGVNIMIVTSIDNENIVDSIHKMCISSHISFRYVYYLHTSYDNRSIWNDINSEFSDIDIRILYIINSNNSISWRPYEDNDLKRVELHNTLSHIYIIPLLILSFIKYNNTSRLNNNRLIVYVDSNTYIDKCYHVLLYSIMHEMYHRHIHFIRCLDILHYV